MQASFSWHQHVKSPADNSEPKAEPGAAMSRTSTRRARVAQMLLVARLNARNRRHLAMDMLERGAHVMWVTCRNWFSSGQPPASGPDAAGNTPNKDNDAHRDH
jgi:hypothetical protein